MVRVQAYKAGYLEPELMEKTCQWVMLQMVWESDSRLLLKHQFYQMRGRSTLPKLHVAIHIEDTEQGSFLHLVRTLGCLFRMLCELGEHIRETHCVCKTKWAFFCRLRSVACCLLLAA